MAAQTGIQWTDSTFNPWIGCTKVGPGCDHCYAEADWDKRKHRVQWGAGNERSRTSAAYWKQPLKWNAEPFVECTECHWRGQSSGLWVGRHNGAHEFECPECGNPVKEARRRVFCASLADWLDNEVPIEWLADLLDLIRRTPNLDWLLLTKRIGIFADKLVAAGSYANENWGGQDRCAVSDFVEGWIHDQPPENVWIGDTMVKQPELDRDLSKLYAVPAVIRFISVEPMISGLDFSAWPLFGPDGKLLLHWVICGGESGHDARPMHPDWARSLRDQCQAAGVPFFFKQWGEFRPQDDDEGPLSTEYGDHIVTTALPMVRVGKKAAGRLLDGRLWNEFPKVAA